jgi:hypothetical protein
MTRNLEDWLLTSLERGNPATLLDERHAGMAAWSAGNQVRPLVHGAVYFAELLAGVDGLRASAASRVATSRCSAGPDP